MLGVRPSKAEKRGGLLEMKNLEASHFQASCGIANEVRQKSAGLYFCAPRDAQRAPNHYVQSSR